MSILQKLRTIYILAAILFGALSAHAVLPEDDLEQTIATLTDEIDAINSLLDVEKSYLDYKRSLLGEEMLLVEDRLAVANLVILSQTPEHPLGLARATQYAHDALKQYDKFTEPAEEWMEYIDNSILRVEGLKARMQDVNPSHLSAETRRGLELSIARCDSIVDFYRLYKSEIVGDNDLFERIAQDANRLQDNIHKASEQLRDCIFVDGNETYPEYLRHSKYSNVTILINSMKPQHDSTLSTGYDDDDVEEIEGVVWKLSLIVAVILWLGSYIYGKKWKPTAWCYHYRGALFLLAFFGIEFLVDIALQIFANTSSQVARERAFDLIFNALWLLIVLSHITRPNSGKLRYVILSCLPMLLTNLLLMSMITAAASLNEMIVVLPIVYGVFAGVQLIINLLWHKKLSHHDKITAWINFIVLAACFLLTWNGRTILSVMLALANMALWAIWVTYFLLQYWVLRRYSNNGSAMARYTMQRAVYPLLLILALVASIYLVAGIFSLSAWLTDWLREPFIELPDVCTVSISRLIFIVALGVVVNYIVGMARRHFLRDNSRYATGNTAVIITVCSILAWLGFAITVIALLQINHTGIIAAIGGASVGLGFALRDTFENFFYGLTMMTGRARPGDIVECDDIRGYVRHVGVISTSLETEDGPIVSLPNRQLFGKNFKNLTTNNSRELRHITVDIDANNDIDLARRLMLESVTGIDGVIEDGDHYVIMRNYGSGVVRMEIKVWIDTRKYLRAEPAVREAIYHAFNDNGIKVSNIFTTIGSRTADSLMRNSFPK